LAVADCIQASFGFPACRKRAVEVDFSGGAVSSNSGVLLMRAVDRRLGLSAAAARVLRDPRDPGRCRHSAVAQLRQRLYGLALGYEDLNDHSELRHDLALQTAVDRVAPLASAPTLCRFDGIGLWIRLGITETPVFQKVLDEERVERVPVLEVLKRQPKQVALTTLLRMPEQAPGYIVGTFIFTYARVSRPGTESSISLPPAKSRLRT
jgi:hypothetical protein